MNPLLLAPLLLLSLLAFSSCGDAEEQNQSTNGVEVGDGEHGDGEHGDGEHGDGEHGDGEHGDGEHGDGEHGDGEHGDGEHGDGEHGDGEHGEGDGSTEPADLNVIAVQNQNASLSTIVVIDEVELEDNSVIAIFRDSCNDGEYLGSRHQAAGTYQNLSVELTQRGAANGTTETLCASLFDDLGTGVFDPETAELLLGDVTALFEFTVGDTTPALRIRLASQGSQSYTVLGVIPSTFASIVDTDPASSTNDPRFTFTNGWRYEIENTVRNAHPFVFRSANDSDQLAQHTTGALESDPTIGWEDTGTFMRFTVSDSFQSTITKHRCAPHPLMTGAVVYTD